MRKDSRPLSPPGIWPNPWGRKLSNRGFNGATAFLPWNLLFGIVHPVIRNALQWGHGISAVESGTATTVNSMSSTSLQWGHGISAVESPRFTPPCHVRSWLQWGHGISAVESHHGVPDREPIRVASMGPRHFCRGILAGRRLV